MLEMMRALSDKLALCMGVKLLVAHHMQHVNITVTQVAHWNVAHISLVQSLTLGNVLYISYTPPDSAFTEYKALI